MRKIGKVSKTYIVGTIEKESIPARQTSGIALRLKPYYAERGQSQFAIGWNRKNKRLNLPFISIWFF